MNIVSQGFHPGREFLWVRHQITDAVTAHCFPSIINDDVCVPSVSHAAAHDDVGYLLHQRFVNVYLNDEDVRYLDKDKTAAAPSDTLSIVPSIAGGRS